MTYGGVHLLVFTWENLFNSYVTNGEWDEAKYDEYNAARALLPGYSAYADSEIGKQKNEQYMERYGLTWDDVRSPWSLPGDSLISSAGSSLSRSVNFVSKNLEMLYDDRHSRRKKH